MENYIVLTQVSILINFMCKLVSLSKAYNSSMDFDTIVALFEL
jgi:hypothetical protein